MLNGFVACLVLSVPWIESSSFINSLCFALEPGLLCSESDLMQISANQANSVWNVGLI